MVTLENLVAATLHMRSLQKAYFKDRNHIVLKQAQKAEKELDQLLIQLERQQSPPQAGAAQQGRLFD